MHKKILKCVQPSFFVKIQLCFRSNGLVVQMEGAAIVFQSENVEQDRGLYTCQASFYHHTATVHILVEVKKQDKLFGEYLL